MIGENFRFQETMIMAYTLGGSAVPNGVKSASGHPDAGGERRRSQEKIGSAVCATVVVLDIRWCGWDPRMTDGNICWRFADFPGSEHLL